MTPEAYLRRKGYKLRNAPGEHQTQCPFCGDKNKAGHLYVNREHGAFYCHRCGESGSFFKLQEKLGDRPEPSSKQLADKWAVWDAMVEICQDSLLSNREMLDYLKKKRHLKPATIGKYRLGFAPDDLIPQLQERGFQRSDLKHAGLYSEKDNPLFWNRLIIPYFQRDRVVTVRGKHIGSNTLQAKDTSIHLYGVDNIRGHAEVYICEGELDAMYLDQLGYPACSIPGALSWQEHWNWWFEDVRRVFIVLDADDAGHKGALKIAQALGRKARIITLPVPDDEETTDITEYFIRDGYTTGDFDELISEMRGQRLYSVEEALEERDAMRLKQGLLTGWATLDRAIHPGLLPGQIVTILAKTGAGKTALLTQLNHNLSSWQPFDKTSTGPSVPTLVLSLEQTKAEIGERLQRIGSLFNPWADRKDMAQWYSRVLICDENRIPSSDIPLLLEEFVEEVGMEPRLVVVDYLGYWSRAFKGKSKYEQVSEAIMSLKEIAKANGVAIIAPHQVSRAGRAGQRLELDFARDSGVVEETSDFVFSMFRPDIPEDQVDEASWQQKAEVKIEILKSRHGAVGRTFTFYWAPYSLALVERDNDPVVTRRIEKEWACEAKEFLYEDVLQVHQGQKWIHR